MKTAIFVHVLMAVLTLVADRCRVVYSNGNDGNYYHNIDFLDVDDEEMNVEAESDVYAESKVTLPTEFDSDDSETQVAKAVEAKPVLLASQTLAYSSSKCELINMKLCMTSDIRYNLTIFPNKHGHKTQTEAAEALYSFNALIESQCSVYTRLFLCSEFIPMCALRPIAQSSIYIEEPLRPCKSMCVHVKSKCEVLLLAFGISWPKMLDCDRLPEDSMCIKPPAAASTPNNLEYEDYLISNLKSPFENNMNKLINHIRTKNLNMPAVSKPASSFQKDKIVKKVTQTLKNSTKLSSDASNTNTLCANRKHFLPTSFLLNAQETIKSFKKAASTLNSTAKKATVDLSQCVPICSQDVLFTQNEKAFSELCSFILALICFATTLYVLILYIFKSNLFQYPEHIIVIISLCYNAYSIPFIIRFFLGFKKASCENYDYHLNIDNLFDALFYPVKAITTTKRFGKMSDDASSDETYVLVKESLENTWCTVTFIFTYFFQTASTIWWVVLSFIWFLVSNRTYSPTLFRTLNNYYHLFAWTIPTVFTIIALIWKRVDADELTGMCSVGNQDTHALLVLVILPFCVYLLIGVACIVAGFIAIYKVREAPKQNSNTTNDELKSDSELIDSLYCIRNIDQILFKIGIFSIVYVIPVIYIILSNLYHFMNYNVWYLNKVSTIHNNDEVNNAQISNYPITEIYIFRHFISFLMGVSAFAWILTSNASTGLLKLLRNLICQCLFCNNTTIKTITQIDKHSSASTRRINNDRINVRLKNSTTLMSYQQTPHEHHQSSLQPEQFNNTQMQFNRQFMLSTPNDQL